MGRNNKKHTERNVKTRNKHNLNSDKQELKECVELLLKLSTSIPQPTIISKALDNHNEISSVIDKIKNLELNKSKVEDAESNARNSPDKLVSFTKWLKDNGAVFDGCSIAEFSGYDLGLKADIDIPYGSLFIAVPKKLMLTVESAKRSILKRYMEKDEILKNMPNVALAIYLLVEKFKENSFYKPYINVLPKTYSTVLYFSEAELSELKGSPTLELALKHIRSTARQYSYFHTIFFNNDDEVSRLLRVRFTYEEYCWAVSTIMTRQNFIPSDDNETKVSALIPLWDLCNHTNGMISTDYNPDLKRSECLALKDFKKGEQLFIFYGPRTNAEFFIHNGWAVSTIMTRQNFIPSDDNETKVSALIPLWDLCNHTNGMISTDYNPDLKRSECLALKDFKKGEQLFIFYGPRTNAEFFIHNGFIPAENEYDSYTLKLGVSKCDPLKDKRTLLLKKLEIGSTQEFKLGLKENPVDGKLLAFLRIFNMNEDQLDHWIKSNKSGDLEYVECALDVSLEEKTWIFLQTRLKLILATYQTTLEQDEKLLNEQKISLNAMIAVKMRKSEKEIICRTLNWLEKHVKQ